MTIPRWLGIPRRSAGTRHRIPFGERPHPKHAVVRRPKEMSPDLEEIQHESVDREKPLRVRSGFESAPVIQPDGVADDLGGKAVSVVAWRVAFHRPSLPRSH